jgi:hypothetical protein
MIGIDVSLAAIIVFLVLVGFVTFVSIYLLVSAQNDFKKLLISLPLIEKNTRAVYDYLMPIAIIFYTISAILSALVLMGEFLNLFPKETAFSMFIWSIVGVVLTVVFPDIWNGIAMMMQTLAESIIDNSPIKDAVTNLFKEIGTLGKIDVPDWSTFLNPQSLTEATFRDTIATIFRAFVAAMLVFLMYVIGTIRIVLTAVMAVAFPLMFALHQIPLLKRVTGKMIDTFIGLTIAPLLSALVVVIGVSVIVDNFPLMTIQSFLAAFAVMLLAILIPTITAPLLGSVVTQATLIGQSALMSGLFATIKGAEGFARGALGVYKGLATLGTWSSLPTARKALELAKGGILGAGSGIASGTLQQVAEAGKGLGLADFAKPLARVADVMHGVPDVFVRRAVTRLATEHRGSLIEGATLLYAKEALSDSNRLNAVSSAVEEMQGFFGNVKQLADAGNHAGVADEFNKMLKIPNYDKLDKDRLGRSLAEYASAFNSNNTASRAFYAGLKQLSSEGGLEGLMKNRADAIDDIVYSGHEYIKPALEKELGIQIPDSIHGMDVKPSDGQLKVMYEVKYTIGSLLKNVDDNLRAGLTFSGVELQGTIRESLTGLIQNKYPNLSDWQVSSIVRNVVDEAKSLAVNHGYTERIGTNALHTALYNLQTGSIEPTVDTQTIDLSDLTTENGKLLKPEQKGQPADFFNYTK